MRGFGRTIALWGFIAVQQFLAGFDTRFVTAAMTAVRGSMQFVLPNRTPLPATREAGLVQIADALTDAYYSRNVGIAQAFRKETPSIFVRMLRRFPGSSYFPGSALMKVFISLMTSASFDRNT